MSITVEWQESQQNFVVTGARYPGISEGLCTTRQGEIQDRQGGRAMLSWTDPCLVSGNVAVQHYQVPAQSASVSPLVSPTVVRGREQRAATAGSFFLCESSLTIRQDDRVFTENDFRLVDLAGTEVCRELPPGTSLDVLLQVEATSDLNFNTPFVAAYENRDVVAFDAGPPRGRHADSGPLHRRNRFYLRLKLGVLSPQGAHEFYLRCQCRGSRVTPAECADAGENVHLTNSGTGGVEGRPDVNCGRGQEATVPLVSDETLQLRARAKSDGDGALYGGGHCPRRAVCALVPTAG